MNENTPGREPVTIVEILQPRCQLTYGSAPCNANGAASAKCYNTFSTCQDKGNFGRVPEPSGGPDRVYSNGDTLINSDFERGADVFWAADVTIPDDAADGVIWELGGATVGAYFGISGGEIKFLIGPDNQAVVIAVSAEPYAGQSGSFYGTVDISSRKISLWWQRAGTRTLALLGTSSTTDSFNFWAGTDPGAVGRREGSFVQGESDANFGGTINEVRFYDVTYFEPKVNQTLSLFFSTGTVAAQGVPGTPYIIPSLVSASAVPTRINLTGANPDAKGLGNRATATLVFDDHQHTDRIVDPYLSDRTWDPLDADRGTFWQRWRARNLYRKNIKIRVYNGYAGQSLVEMVVRTYFLEEFSGPSNGRVTIRAKDVLARVEERKAQAPLASPGTLRSETDASVSVIGVNDAQVSDYPAPGVVRINDELIRYTAASSVDGYIQLRGLTRGYDGTTPEEHEVEDGVQLCISYENANVDEVVYDLCVNYAGISPGLLNSSAWAVERATYLDSFKVNALLTEPEGVIELLSQLQIQCSFYLFWDERSALVEMRAMRRLEENPRLLTDADHILRDSFSITELPRERASRVWLYYGRFDQTAGLEDPQAYLNPYIAANLELEGDNAYGEKSVRKIFARWLNVAALASTTAGRILSQYQTTPSEIQFSLDAKDRDIWVGDMVEISHFADRDEFGAKRTQRWIIVEAEEVRAGETVTYVAQSANVLGIVNFIMAPGSVDYPGAGLTPAKNAYIGDSNGLLSDGSPAARII